MSEAEDSMPKGQRRQEKKGARQRRGEPLEVRLTVKVKFGAASDDSVTIMDDRAVPMVDSVFYYRDQILRGMTTMLFKAVKLQPRLAREVIPVLDLVRNVNKNRG